MDDTEILQSKIKEKNKPDSIQFLFKSNSIDQRNLKTPSAYQDV